jgi:hypothetical protein
VGVPLEITFPLESTGSEARTADDGEMPPPPVATSPAAHCTVAVPVDDAEVRTVTDVATEGPLGPDGPDGPERPRGPDGPDGPDGP